MGKKNEFSYQIDGRTYVQKPLVLGQIEQLLDVIDGIELRHDMTQGEILAAVKKDIPLAMAVILCEKDTKLADKDIDTLAKELKFSVDFETAQAIVTDFFVCNPIVSLLKKLRENVSKVLDAIKAQVGGSTNSA